jgi:DNA-directed RNA polymerase
MCLPYGLTKYSSKEYVRDWYLEKARSTGNRPFEKDSVWEAVTYLTEKIWEAIGEIVVAAVGAMDWLKKCARVHVEAGIPIRWSSPSGFLVEQNYKKLSRVVVKTTIGAVLRQHRVLVEDDMMSMSRNVNAISPNVVHSIDAAILIKAVNLAAYNGIQSFSCIHDSFGICAADAGVMGTVIRQVSSDIFTQPILKTLQSEMQAYLPKGFSLPEPPPMGTLDIGGLMKADYFFA